MKSVLKVGALLLAAAFAAGAQAQQFPTKPVRMIVPVPAGAGLDIITRVLAQKVSPVWGQPIVLENQPGANSLIGTAAVAKAAPDGHTLLVAPDGTMTVNPHLYEKLPYDPVKDLAPITLLVTFNQMLLANPGVPADSLQNLVKYAKANPGKVTYSSFGIGSQPHLLGEMLAYEAKIDLTHVPYKGAPPAVLAAVTGETSLTWSSPFNVAAHVKGGKLKALAIAAPKRSAHLPDVPTFKELGMPNMEWELWFGLFAPAGTPAAVVNKIHGDFSKALNDPALAEKELRAKGYEPSGKGPAEFATLIQKEIALRGSLVKRVGAKAE